MGVLSSCDPVYTEWSSERGESSAYPQEDTTTKRGGGFHEQRQHRVAAAPPHTAAWTSLGDGRSSYGSALTSSCCHIVRSGFQVQINDTWGTSLCRTRRSVSGISQRNGRCTSQEHLGGGWGVSLCNRPKLSKRPKAACVVRKDSAELHLDQGKQCFQLQETGYLSAPSGRGRGVPVNSWSEYCVLEEI